MNVYIPEQIYGSIPEVKKSLRSNDRKSILLVHLFKENVANLVIDQYDRENTNK